MNGTLIYKRHSSRRFLLGAVGILALCFLLFKPVRGATSETQSTKEEIAKTVFTVESDSPAVEPESISAKEFYIIRTQSNEYIVFVDARSEEEYQTSHITSSISMKTFEERNPLSLRKIRIFFYSNDDTRSRQVAASYAAKGLRAYFIVGGLSAWEDEYGILPIVHDE